MGGTDVLREDHRHIRRFETVVARCSDALYGGTDVPLSDIEEITVIMSEFLDSIHYSREEDSYFPCAGASGDFASEVRKFLIEHQFGRNVALQVSRHLGRWKSGEDAREPVARFLRTYAVYLRDHLAKEDEFFDRAEKAMDPDEEAEMFEYFRAVMASTERIERMIKKIEELEARYWCADTASGTMRADG